MTYIYNYTHLNCCICLYHLPVVVIGFERTAVTALEQQDSVELCASIQEGTLGRNVDVAFSTQPGTATGIPSH